MTKATNKSGASFATQYDALFLSDPHALHSLNGAIHKQARILNAAQVKTIYLVGDIVDWESVVAHLRGTYKLNLQQMPTKIDDLLARMQPILPRLEQHLRYMDLIFQKIQEGTEVIYTPGNHDENMDLLNGQNILGIEICQDTLYKSASGQVYQVEHGHRFDPGWLQRDKDWYKYGSRWLDTALMTDVGIGHLIPALKDEFIIANAIKRIGKFYIKSFEQTAALKAKMQNVDGIVCGHIHDMNVKRKEKTGMLYINCGDGLTHATAIAHASNLSDTPEKQWVQIKAKHIKSDWSLANFDPDPALRAKTLEFLQIGWSACLQMLEHELKAKPNLFCPKLEQP